MHILEQIRISASLTNILWYLGGFGVLGFWGVEAAQISQKISNWSDVPSSWKKLGAYKKISFASDPYDKNLQKFLEPFASDDDLRPNLTGMNFDDTGITCTDAHKLVVLPYPNSEYKGIYCTFKRCAKIVAKEAMDKNGKLKDVKYPRYEQVIPIYGGKDQFHNKINVRKLLTYINVADNFANVTTHQINFKYNRGGLIGFNANFLKVICESMLLLGYEDAWFHLSIPNRAMVVTPHEKYKVGEDVIMLCMPVMTDSAVYFDRPGAEDKDWEKEITAYFDFNDGEIHNADKSVADFHKDTEVITVEPEQIRFLKSAIDKNAAIPIIDHPAVIDNNIIGTDLENYAVIKESGLKDGEYEIVEGELVWRSGANDIEQFPKVYKTKEELGKVHAPEFEKVYEDAVKFTIKNQLQPEFEGVHLFTKDEKLVMESCDAAIAYRNVIKGFEFKKDFDFVLRTKCIKSFLNYIGDANIKISDTDWKNKGVSDSFISLSAADAELVSRTITPAKKKYPSLDAVIMSEAENKITFEHKQLEQLIDKIDVPALKKKYEYLKKGRNEIAVSLTPKTSELQPSGKIEIFMIIWQSGYSMSENIIIERTLLGTIDYSYNNNTSHVNKEKFAIIMPVMTVVPEDMFCFDYEKLTKIIEVSEGIDFSLQYNKLNGVFVSEISKAKTELVKIPSAKDTVRALEVLIALTTGDEAENYVKELEKIKSEHKGEKFKSGGKIDKGLTDIFIHLYEHNKEIKEDVIPSEIKNKFAEWQGDFLYAGSKGAQNMDDIKSWTSDKETAKVFATKYKDGKVFEMHKGEFKKKFNFISLDVFADFIEEKGLWNKRIDKYVSESEVYVLSQKFADGGSVSGVKEEASCGCNH